LDDLEVGEDFRDFLAAVFDFGEDVLGQRAIDEAARLEKVDELGVVHEGRKELNPKHEIRNEEKRKRKRCAWRVQVFDWFRI
jgi:hypothetical protein